MIRAALLFLVSGVLLIGAPAMAVTFSFASDDNHDGPTFQGNSGGSMPNDLNDAAAFNVDSVVNCDLRVDLNDDAPGGVVTFQAELVFAGDISNYTLTARGSNWVHQWDVTGTALFTHSGTGQPILEISFKNALLTTLSPNIVTLGETAALQDSEGVDAGIRFTTFPLLQGIGVNDVAVATSEDFAFTMTRLRRPDNGGLPRIDHGLFLRDWVSEGSFSAHATSGLSQIPVETQ